MCLHVICPVPKVDSCELASSTKQSLKFSWTRAKSVSSYHFVGHLVNESTTEPEITVNGLTPGSLYSFTVWAEDYGGRGSNVIFCINSTGLQSKLVKLSVV